MHSIIFFLSLALTSKEITSSQVTSTLCTLMPSCHYPEHCYSHLSNLKLSDITQSHVEVTDHVPFSQLALVYCYVMDLWCAIYSYGFVCLCLLNCVYNSMLGFTCIYNPNVGFLGFPI